MKVIVSSSIMICNLTETTHCDPWPVGVGNPHTVRSRAVVAPEPRPWSSHWLYNCRTRKMKRSKRQIANPVYMFDQPDYRASPVHATTNAEK